VGGAKLSGGGTLVLMPGSYGEIGNQPVGKPGAWNVIKAATDGTVTVSGLNLGKGRAHYLQIEGVDIVGSGQKNIAGSFVKLIRSSVRGGPASNNVSKLVIGTSDATPGADMVLLEDVLVYGSGGRYDVLVYNSDRVVLRRVIARHGGGWTDTKGDPQGSISLYNSRNIVTQNIVAIDVPGNIGYFEAAIYHPSNTRQSQNIAHYGAMIGFISGIAVGWDDHTASSGNLFDGGFVRDATYGAVINGAAHEVTINKSKFFNTPNGIANFSGGKLTVSSADLATFPATKLGKDGTLYGEAGYLDATSSALFPMPMEARFKALLAADASRGWAATALSLRDYLNK
jgi:hypothetical protein